jgi:hypothetical protein
MDDRSHRVHTLHTTLSAAQVTHEFTFEKVSQSWYDQYSELFVKQVYKQTERDTLWHFQKDSLIA